MAACFDVQTAMRLARFPRSSIRRIISARPGATLLLLALLIGHVAQAGDKKSDGRKLAQKAAARFPQTVKVGALLNRTVLEPLESQPKLGTVKAIVRTADKSIEAVVEYGGLFGFGAKPIAVPIHAMTLMGEYMEIVDFSPEELAAFPEYDAAGTTPLSRDDIIRVGLAKPTH